MSLPVPVAPQCPLPMDAADCALAAQWAAVKTAEITADWIAATFWAQVAGGAAAAVAAIFAFMAYRANTRSAVAAERQADHARDQVAETQRASAAQMQASATQIRPHLRWNPVTVAIARHGKSQVSLRPTCAGQRDILRLNFHIRLILKIDDDVEFDSQAEILAHVGPIHLPSSGSESFDLDFELPAGAIDFDLRTWRRGELRVVADWSDEMNYLVNEEIVFLGAILPGEASARFERDNVIFYKVTDVPIIED